MISNSKVHEDSKNLASEIASSSLDANPIERILKTDEKVIARITDGIYRQPASALRELISNAYDADSTIVSIQTDYPRFEQITIRDNGNGMNENALANLILHIGGSAKRDSLGKEIGVTDPEDATKTLGGRSIIGKIGIGLFSVAQLTQQFQIITKVKNTDYRLVANVTLKTFSEIESSSTEGDEFESGTVSIRKVKATDIDAHGTDIILINLRKNALSILRSEDLWSRVDNADTDKLKNEYTPKYHIGKYTNNSNSYFEQQNKENYPWPEELEPKLRFKNIYTSLLDEYENSRSTPSLENTFDNYFQMLWTLALSSPINYIEKHPFLLTSEDEPQYFEISNKSSEQVKELNLLNTNYHSYKNTLHPFEDPVGDFAVYVDGIKLFRPLAYNNQKKSNSALQKPLMFYGSYKSDWGKTDKSMSGGDLKFEGYFYWNSKILPQDHNGISIRINNASGTLFDSGWLKYAVAEKTTLGQITAEIFIIEGLDAALNIDRESFNYSHPHYQILCKWVHNALRQITAKQKKLRSEKNQEIKSIKTSTNIKRLYELPSIKSALSIINRTPIFSTTEDQVKQKRHEGYLSFLRGNIFSKPPVEITEEKLKTIIAILESRDLISSLSYSEQEDLIKDIAEIISFES